MKIEMKNKAREAFANKLLEKLESGNLVWRQGWGLSNVPYNEKTKLEYRGLNRLILSFQSIINAYNDPRWLTFNQAKDAGYKIKDGSKATPIEVSKYIDKETNQEVTSEFLDNKKNTLTNDEFQEYLKNGFYRLQKTYLVFNGTQIEGLKEYKMSKMSDEDMAIRNYRIDKIINNSEAKVFYDGNDQAYYKESTDSIHVPKQEMFNSMEELYTTILHEMAHSTGHESRLNRKLSNTFASSDYAYEELVAEIASVLTAQDLGLELSNSQFTNHAAYIQSWYRAISENPDILFKAIKDADKANEYILSYEELEDKNNLEVLIKWSEHPYFKEENIKMPFNEANQLIKVLDRYTPKDMGCYKTEYTIFKNNEELYSGRIDIGDGNYTIEHKEHYGILEEIEDYLKYYSKYYRDLLEKEDYEIISKEDLNNLVTEYENLLKAFVPILWINSDINEKQDLDLNKMAYNMGLKLVMQYENHAEDKSWADRENERLAEIYLRYNHEDTKEKEASTLKIAKDMSDEDRVKILDTKSLDIHMAKENSIFSRLGDKIENLETIANMQFVEAKRFFKKLDNEFTHVGTTFENRDMGLEFEFTKHGLKESVEKQKSSYENYAKLLSCLPEVIDNAIGLEIHDDYKPDQNKSIKNIYVLVSAFHDGENIHPVKLLIKEFSDENKSNKLYVAISLESFEIKKEEVDIVNTRSESNETRPVSNQTSSINIIANYPIKSILSNVSINDRSMIKYIPDKYLDEDKIKIKNIELDKVNYSKTLEIKNFDENTLDNFDKDTENENHFKLVIGDTMKDYKEYFKEKRLKTLSNLEKNVPDEMKKLNQWCAFKTFYDKEKDKNKKIILNANIKDKCEWAKCDDKNTWTSFDNALDYAKKNDCAGLAFALVKENNITCIDLDHHIEKNGKRSELVWDLLNSSNGTYAEKSISSTGAHIFTTTKILDEKVALKNDAFNIECYEENRFISMTGNIISKTNTLKEVSDKFVSLAKEKLGERQISHINEDVYKTEYITRNRSHVSDYEVIEKIRKSKVASDFDSLYSGFNLCGDHSRSDYKLMNILAFFTNSDIHQMKRIFRSSGLYRPEKREDYLDRTARNAATTLRERASDNLYKERIKIKTKINSDQMEK